MPVTDARTSFFDMTVSEAARTFGLTEAALLAACRAGVVGHVRWGRRVQRVTGADVGGLLNLSSWAGVSPSYPIFYQKTVISKNW